VLGDVLTEVDSAVEAVLAKITISDVVQRLKPCGGGATNTQVEKSERKRQYERERISLSQLRAGAKTRRAKALRSV
jgi:hypothetical protein